MMAMVVRMLIESTSWEAPKSSRIMGFTTVVASHGNNRQSSNTQPAWINIEKYWSLWVTSWASSLVRCMDTSFVSHFVQ